MHFLAGFFLFVGSFFSGLFPAPEPIAPIIEVLPATTTPALPDTKTVQKASVPAAKVAVPKPAAAPFVPSVATPAVATTTATASSTSAAKSGGSGGSATASLALTTGSLSHVTEKDTIRLKVTYGGADVTKEASFEVVGPIGSVKDGVFTAKLSGDLAEFGHAPGAIVATYKGMTSETPIFEVEAFIPENVTTSGQ